ncbi:hypothetical protein BY996DRAFT_6514559 [Phakopsora pachyrhizi]|nr:hypothetical protein BY996DRAFT_6514559 [Phakopsora pachyrhizi]
MSTPELAQVVPPSLNSSTSSSYGHYGKDAPWWPGLWLYRSLYQDTKKLYQLILGNHSNLPTRDDKGKFVNLSNLLKEKLDIAHSIIITNIDDSLLC